MARLDDIDLTEGQWLILAQAGYILNPVVETLKSCLFFSQRPMFYVYVDIFSCKWLGTTA